MHSSIQQHGGDLKVDTVTIIGATLDLQEKVVREVRGSSQKRNSEFFLLNSNRQ